MTMKAGLGAALAVSSLATISTLSTVSTAGASSNPCSATLPSKVTNITFWESAAAGTAANNGNAYVLSEIVNAYNKSQKKVHVTAVNQTSGYQGTWDSYLATLAHNTNVPNVLYDNVDNLQGEADSGAILPIQDCITATKYSTSGYGAKYLSAEKIGNTIWALPYGESAPILYYNKQAFAKAGISTPPTTLTAMAADSRLLKSHGYTDGMALKNDPWWLEIWSGIAGQDFVNNSNGRSGFATAATFNNSYNNQVLTQLQNMYKAGDAKEFPSTGVGLAAYGNLLDIASGGAGMTIDTSAAIADIQNYLPLYKNVTLGAAPLPLLNGNESGGIAPGGNALSIATGNTSTGGAPSSAQIAASWNFIQFLESPSVMASWSALSSYEPSETTATTAKFYTGLAPKGYANLAAYWKAYPYYAIAYNAVNSGPNNADTLPPLIGPYYTVATDVANAEAHLLTDANATPSSVLSSAQSAATSDIRSYNNQFGR